ncbi:major facilitator superfamily transporter [Fusarium beomiforme]|uniref:Major facilitator superfamily transporter n=1 Tax=Fusarium beomiforme TaxID=44412 RepID=A0A9P5DUJ3_9HYPO|nr:major facilitator superfamily transporter [Fusarium beomiforme]
MWSFVQHRQIAKEVRLDHKKDVESAKNIGSSSSQKRSLSTPNGERRSGRESAQQTSNKTRFQVQTSGEDDPLNPLNWSLATRIRSTFIVCLLVFTQCWAGSAISLGNSMASKQLHVSQVAENLSIAMFLFGVGTGALFAGPISETVGRNPTYLVATAFHLCFVLGSAMTPTFGGQVVCRFLVGLSASATLTINGASVNDQFRPVKRALVFPIVAWANVAAPVIAPIAGGWIVSNTKLGWRWTEWITLILSGAAFIVALLFLPETYFPLILSWKAKELRRITGDQRYTSEHEQKDSFWKQMKATLPLPATFFRSEPVIIVLGLYLILLYSLLFSFLSGFDYIFKKTYSLKPGYQGSCFAAIAAGATAFGLIGPALYEWSRQHTERVRGASIQPEFRLWPAIVTAPFLPISLFWLGWTNYPSISLWSGLVACFLFGIVLMSMYVSSYEYITDSYGKHSAIALGSITMSRYLIAGGMVMAARPMYEGIGVHWTMTLLGCVATLLTPAPILFWKYGPRLRRKSPYATSHV